MYGAGVASVGDGLGQGGPAAFVVAVVQAPYGGIAFGSVDEGRQAVGDR